MGLLSKKEKSKSSERVSSVQTGMYSTHPYYQLASYIPFNMQTKVYIQLRQAVPILDAALNKIVRLCDGFTFCTGNDTADRKLNDFFENVNVGGNQQGISAFISNYLNQLLTCGSAVGEIVLNDGGIYALYNAELENLEVKRSQNGIDIEFYNSNKKIEYPQLVLYSVLNPKPGDLGGTSLLEGLPFISDILMKIYNAIGQNWDHAGNIRYAVTYKPSADSSDKAWANERANQMAQAWKNAMDSKAVKDFVAVGDVDIKVIGADNAVLDSEIPVKQMLEQIVAKTGLPPFMLGLAWSTTERMSKQQADILTTELESYRRILTPVLVKIANMYLAFAGYALSASVVWDDITLQDSCELAQSELYLAQAEKIRKENEI